MNKKEREMKRIARRGARKLRWEKRIAKLKKALKDPKTRSKIKELLLKIFQAIKSRR